RAAVPGRDVRLTLDLDVQTVAEQALADGMAAARAGVPGAAATAAPGGAVVALGVGDGSVLALASAPTFVPAALAGRMPAATGPEAPGRVPGPPPRRAGHERSPASVPDGRWYPGDNVNLAIGQGDVLVTPLQLAGAYAALATGRMPPTPHVVATSGPPASGR